MFYVKNVTDCFLKMLINLFFYMIVNIYVHVVYATMIKCIHTNTITYFASTRLNIVKTLKLMYRNIVLYRDYTIL